MKYLLLALLALSVSLGATAAPLFRNPLPVGTGIEHFSLMEEADFNGDGHKDVLVMHSFEVTRVLSVLLANGTGPFAAPVLTPIDLDYSLYDVGIGDVNEDARTDLVLLDMENEMLAVMFGNGDGTFAQGPTFPGSTVLTGPVTLADFNGDHHLDVAVGTIDNPTMNDRAVVVHFGNGAGSFSGAVKTSVGSARLFETFDINVDGKTDLLIDGDYGNQLYLGNGGGGFSFKSGTSGGEVAPGDFNHDGKLDLAVAADGNHEWYVQVWFGSGDGTLTGGAKYSCGYSPAGHRRRRHRLGRESRSPGRLLHQLGDGAARQSRRHVPSARDLGRWAESVHDHHGRFRPRREDRLRDVGVRPGLRGGQPPRIRGR